MKIEQYEFQQLNLIFNERTTSILCFSQLFYDGYSQIAISLSTEVHADPPCPPSERLLHVVNAGLQHEPDRHKNRDPTPGLNPIQEILIGPGLGESNCLHYFYFLVFTLENISTLFHALLRPSHIEVLIFLYTYFN